MIKQTTIKQIVLEVKKHLDGEGTGHDWWHIERVLKNGIFIGKAEKADLFIVQLAALLHDIADWKFHNGDHAKGAKISREILSRYCVDEKIINHVCEIVLNISFKGAGVKNKIKTLEGKVVQDADRLDALGAIGIARCFAYGGFSGRQIHNPRIRPNHHKTFAAYKNNKGTSINHFYEKLLLLKNMMNTQTGKKMAQERHKFMEKYLKTFFKEWGGKI